MTGPPATGLQLSFQVGVENWDDGTDYCAVPVPAKVTETLGTKGPVLVIAGVNNSDPFQVNRPGFRGGYLVKVKWGFRSSRRVAESSLPQPRPVEYTQSAPVVGGG